MGTLCELGCMGAFAFKKSYIIYCVYNGDGPTASSDDPLALAMSCHQVFEVRFWMMHLQHPTAKRSIVMSNGPWIQGSDLGPLPRRVREEKTQFKTSRSQLSLEPIDDSEALPFAKLGY